MKQTVQLLRPRDDDSMRPPAFRILPAAPPPPPAPAAPFRIAAPTPGRGRKAAFAIVAEIAPRTPPPDGRVSPYRGSGFRPPSNPVSREPSPTPSKLRRPSRIPRSTGSPARSVAAPSSSNLLTPSAGPTPASSLPPSPLKSDAGRSSPRHQLSEVSIDITDVDEEAATPQRRRGLSSFRAGLSLRRALGLGAPKPSRPRLSMKPAALSATAVQKRKAPRRFGPSFNALASLARRLPSPAIAKKPPPTPASVSTLVSVATRMRSPRPRPPPPPRSTVGSVAALAGVASRAASGRSKPKPATPSATPSVGAVAAMASLASRKSVTTPKMPLKSLQSIASVASRGPSPTPSRGPLKGPTVNGTPLGPVISNASVASRVSSASANEPPPSRPESGSLTMRPAAFAIKTGVRLNSPSPKAKAAASEANKRRSSIKPVARMTIMGARMQRSPAPKRRQRPAPTLKSVANISRLAARAQAPRKGDGAAPAAVASPKLGSMVSLASKVASRPPSGRASSRPQSGLGSVANLRGAASRVQSPSARLLAAARGSQVPEQPLPGGVALLSVSRMRRRVKLRQQQISVVAETEDGPTPTPRPGGAAPGLEQPSLVPKRSAAAPTPWMASTVASKLLPAPAPAAAAAAGASQLPPVGLSVLPPVGEPPTVTEAAVTQVHIAATVLAEPITVAPAPSTPDASSALVVSTTQPALQLADARLPAPKEEPPPASEDPGTPPATPDASSTLVHTTTQPALQIADAKPPPPPTTPDASSTLVATTTVPALQLADPDGTAPDLRPPTPVVEAEPDAVAAPDPEDVPEAEKEDAPAATAAPSKKKGKKGKGSALSAFKKKNPLTSRPATPDSAAPALEEKAESIMSSTTNGTVAASAAAVEKLVEEAPEAESLSAAPEAPPPPPQTVRQKIAQQVSAAVKSLRGGSVDGSYRTPDDDDDDGQWFSGHGMAESSHKERRFLALTLPMNGYRLQADDVEQAWSVDVAGPMQPPPAPAPPPSRGRCLQLACCCRCCHRKRPDASQRRTVSQLSKKAPSGDAVEAESLPKLDPSLVEHGSLMKAAIPVLPLPLAWLCLVCNVLLPGLGTAWSGLLCLCFGKPRFSVRDEPQARLGACCVDLVIGVGQLFTVVFCLVGWGWSVWWGVIMLRLARKNRRLKAQGGDAGAAPSVALNQNHDVERAA